MRAVGERDGASQRGVAELRSEQAERAKTPTSAREEKKPASRAEAGPGTSRAEPHPECRCPDRPTPRAAATPSVEDLMARDPEYRALRRKKDTLDELLNRNGFSQIDSTYGGPLDPLNIFGTRGDGKISMDEVLRAAKAGQRGAALLMEQPELVALLDWDKDGLLSIGELTHVSVSLQSRIGELEKLLRSKFERERSAKLDDESTAGRARGHDPEDRPRSKSESTGEVRASPSNTEAASEAAADTPKAQSTDKKGASKAKDKSSVPELPAFRPTSKTVDGRMHELNRNLDKHADALRDAMHEAAASGDKAAMEEASDRLSTVRLCQQTLAQLQQQIFTQASTLLKLYNDMAMSALRNVA